MKRSRGGSRSRKNRIKENRTRCRETEQNPSLLHREFFFFRKEIKRLPCRCAAGAEGLRSMGIGASTPTSKNVWVAPRHCLPKRKNVEDLHLTFLRVYDSQIDF